MSEKDYLNVDLNGKTIVFTGGTDGMGKVAVKKMAQMGAKIMLLGRDEEKALSVVAELNEIAQKKNTHYVPCDLASQESIREAVVVILDKCTKIDLLINCAGANFGRRVLNHKGHEMTWAVNHLAPFLLAQLLLDRLKESAPARIVNLSSATEKSGHIHFNDLQLSKRWSTFRSYTQAKLAMNMVTRKLSNELKGTGVTVNALNPGFIKTNLLRDIRGWEALVGIPYMFFCASKPEVGADRILRVALSKEYEGVSGKYVYEDAVRDPNPEALDEDIVDRVWEISKMQVGI
ncbi:SDR family NAD(P)-dependent oxidoreductase [Puteibacter caeruleilacunae]|nr:SDR family NAD(P)-dependent oxidoreductase [Puteibacter caeruleilacunae]